MLSFQVVDDPSPGCGCDSGEQSMKISFTKHIHHGGARCLGEVLPSPPQTWLRKNSWYRFYFLRAFFTSCVLPQHQCLNCKKSGLSRASPKPDPWAALLGQSLCPAIFTGRLCPRACAACLHLCTFLEPQNLPRRKRPHCGLLLVKEALQESGEETFYQEV